MTPFWRKQNRGLFFVGEVFCPDRATAASIFSGRSSIRSMFDRGEQEVAPHGDILRIDIVV